MRNGKKAKEKVFTLKVVGSKWTKVLTEDLPPGLLGQCDPIGQRITIRDKLPRDLTGEVELHEVLHGIFSSTPLARRLSFYHPELEEDIVETLSPLLIAYLRDNKKRFDL